MKKVLLTIVGLLAVWAVAASAAPNPPPNVSPQQGAIATQVGGMKDKRIITPDMNARERFEAQRAIQKRAAANRNKLMLQAAEEEKRAKEKTQSGHPVDPKAK